MSKALDSPELKRERKFAPSTPQAKSSNEAFPAFKPDFLQVERAQDSPTGSSLGISDSHSAHSGSQFASSTQEARLFDIDDFDFEFDMDKEALADIGTFGKRFKFSDKVAKFKNLLKNSKTSA